MVFVNGYLINISGLYRDGASRSYAATLPGANGRNPVVRSMSWQFQLEYVFAGK